MQIVALPLVLTVGLAFTVTTAVAAELVQLLASVTVTEYVVVEVGLAVGLDTVVELNPVEGDQV